MLSIKYTKDINKVSQLSSEERIRLGKVTEKYPFRANEYYLGLVEWDNPDDPIRKIIIPSEGEMEPWGNPDASKEMLNYKAPGLQHKYSDTALFILNRVCGSYCRFCFRKRLFITDSFEVMHDINPGLEYINSHPEITNLLLTGGEPLLLSSEKLEKIFKKIFKIPHISIIRIGTKIPVFNPFRILHDPSLLKVLHLFRRFKKRLYIMLHINHPKELTELSRRAIEQIHQTGAVLCSQSPILRGINDDPEVLRQLMRQLSFLGIAPYYFFINRPAMGNKPFCVPITEAYTIFNQARVGLSGLARRPRLVMSHTDGKIEVTGLTEKHLFLHYYRSRKSEDEMRMMVFERDDNAYWFDDLTNLVEMN